MIQKIGYINDESVYLVSCDGKNCNVNIYVEEFNFNDVISYLRDKNWFLVKVSNCWMHYCPNCSKK